MQFYRRTIIATALAALFTASVIVLASAVKAQMVTKTMTQDDLFIIPGIGAVVAPEDEKLKILVVPQERPKEYTATDIEANDFLLMVNGKRVKSIDELRAAFAQIKVGDMIELGIKRDKAMMITSLKRAADDDTGGKMVMMRKTVGDEGEDEGKGGMHFRGEGPVDVVVVGEIGLVINGGDDGLTVMAVMDGPEKVSEGEKPDKAMKIKTLQGKPVTTIEGFELIYGGIPVGEMVTLGYESDGGTKEVSFVRREVKQKSMMIKQ